MKTVGFVGLGAMGGPMAMNLHEAGFRLQVYNRTARKTEPFADKGIAVCDSPAAAARGADFVVSMVSDDDSTREVMLGDRGVVAALSAGAVIVDSSTNSPAMAREVAQSVAAHGAAYLDAPVAGSILQAANRELVFMVGGDAQAFEQAVPLFEAMGRMHRLIGPAGSGATIKLLNNMLSGTVSTAIAEALSVAEAAGLDPDSVLAILSEGATGCRLMRTKIPKIFARDFAPQFQLALMEKDLRYFLGLAQQLDRPTPVAALVRSQLQSARRSGYGNLDVAAVFLQVASEKPADEPAQ